jgi:hypothetical protein
MLKAVPTVVKTVSAGVDIRTPSLLSYFPNSLVRISVATPFSILRV